jgi:hypothetical protein
MALSSGFLARAFVDPYLEDEARNENSIVLKLTFGETGVLLTGDAEDDQDGIERAFAPEQIRPSGIRGVGFGWRRSKRSHPEFLLLGPRASGTPQRRRCFLPDLMDTLSKRERHGYRCRTW